MTNSTIPRPHPNILGNPAATNTLVDLTAHALIEAELRWTDAVRRGDRASAGAFMSDDFTCVTAGSMDAAQGRAEWLDRVAEPSTLVSFAADGFEVQVFGEVALVQSRCRELARRDEGTEATTFRFVDVWHGAGQTWQIDSRHVGLSPN